MRLSTLLGLAALLLLVLVVPTALAERTHNMQVAFPDERTALVIVDTIGTSNDARAMRIAMDVNGDGEVVESELDESNCWRAAAGQPEYTVALDLYAVAPTQRQCDASGLIGPYSSDIAPVVRTTYRHVTPLARVYGLELRTYASFHLTIAAPPGREAPHALGWTYGGELEAGRWVVTTPGGYAAVWVGFAPGGVLWSDWSSENAGSILTLSEPGTVLLDRDLRAGGYAAVLERRAHDRDQDGVVEPEELTHFDDDPRVSLPYFLSAGGSFIRPTFLGAEHENLVGPVDDRSTTAVILHYRYDVPLSPDGFRLRDAEPWGGTWLLRPSAGRTLAHVSGLVNARVLEDGALWGRTTGYGEVVVDVSSTTGVAFTPPEGAPPTPPGEASRTTTIALYAQESGSLMRWQITDVRTDATARDFRASLDSDADNQVSADEAASYENAARLVPPPEAWPFRLGGALPLRTRVLSVDISGLQDAYNSPDPVRITTTYEADYAASSGVLYALQLDYGTRVGIVGPAGSMIDPASAVNLADVRAGADASMLSGVPGADPWSVTIRPPASPAAPVDPPASPSSSAESTAQVLPESPPAIPEEGAPASTTGSTGTPSGSATPGESSTGSAAGSDAGATGPVGGADAGAGGAPGSGASGGGATVGGGTGGSAVGATDGAAASGAGTTTDAGAPPAGDGGAATPVPSGASASGTSVRPTATSAGARATVAGATPTARGAADARTSDAPAEGAERESGGGATVALLAGVGIAALVLAARRRG